MISIFENEKEFAYYKNGAFEIPLISVLYVSISQIFLPKIAQWYSNKQFTQIANVKKKLSSNIAAVTYPICIFFVLFSSDFILIFLSDKYKLSAIIFTIFNLSLLMRIYDYLDVLIAAKKTKLILYVQVFAIIFNFILNYILIPSIGIKGAAIATLTTLFSYAFILLYFNSKTLNSSLLKIIDLPKITLILLISLIIALPFYYLNIFNHLLLSFAFKLLYFPITYFIIVKFGFLDEKIIDYFKQIIRRLTPL